MVDSLSGKDWVGKWQSKVVMASVTLARTLSVSRVKLICLQGGRFCNEEYKHTQLLKAAVEREWKDGGNDGKILVDVHWTEFDAFICDYPLPLPATNKPAGTKVGGVEKAAAQVPPPPTASGKKQADAQPSKSSGEPAASKKGKDASTAPKDSGKQGKGKPASNDEGSSGKKGAVPAQKPAAESPRPASAVTAQHSCDECEKKFKSKEQLAQHLSSTNHFMVSCQCKGCDRVFSNMAQLKQHQGDTGHRGGEKIHTRCGVPDNSEVWVCGACEKEFKTEVAYENHQLTTGHVDPECPLCNKTFFSAMSLEQHLQATGHGQQFKNFQNTFAYSTLVNYYNAINAQEK